MVGWLFEKSRGFWQQLVFCLLLMVWSHLVVVVPSVSGSPISDVVTNLLGVAFSHPYSYLHVISKAVQWLSVSQLNIFCFWCVGVSLATHTHSYSFIFL